MSKIKKIKKDKNEYPNEIIIIPNNEKKWHEQWYPGRNMLNPPHPWRCLMCSIQPNLGKTGLAKNLILRAHPKFEEIFLLHCGGDMTTEYDDIDVKKISELRPTNSDVFNPKVKTLLILEDKNFKFMKKDALKRLDRIYGYVSTHRNLSILCCTQSFFDVPVSSRRMSNIYVLWAYTKDKDSFRCIARRVGIDKEEIEYLVKTYLHSPYDTLWIDATKFSPYPIRKNGFELIQNYQGQMVKKNKNHYV